MEDSGEPEVLNNEIQHEVGEGDHDGKLWNGIRDKQVEVEGIACHREQSSVEQDTREQEQQTEHHLKNREELAKTRIAMVTGLSGKPGHMDERSADLICLKTDRQEVAPTKKDMHKVLTLTNNVMHKIHQRVLTGDKEVDDGIIEEVAKSDEKVSLCELPFLLIIGIGTTDVNNVLESNFIGQDREESTNRTLA